MNNSSISIIGLVAFLGLTVGLFSAPLLADGTSALRNLQNPDFNRLESTSPVQATEGTACTLEGRVSFNGKDMPSARDCMENDGAIPSSDFKQMCEGLAKAGAQFGGGSAPTVTFSKKCPAKEVQGTCKGIFSPNVTAYYYKRETKDLPNLEKSCVGMRGKWQAAPK
jgi:hypothetical protein